MKVFLILVLILCLINIYMGCTKSSSTGTPAPENKLIPDTNVQDNTKKIESLKNLVKIEYEKTIKPIINGTCVRCHNQFAAYENLTDPKTLNKIKSVLTNKSMPPASVEFSEDKRQSFIDWINKN